MVMGRAMQARIAITVLVIVLRKPVAIPRDATAVMVTSCPTVETIVADAERIHQQTLQASATEIRHSALPTLSVAVVTARAVVARADVAWATGSRHLASRLSRVSDEMVNTLWVKHIFAYILTFKYSETKVTVILELSNELDI
jgi:hypothetical protein